MNPTAAFWEGEGRRVLVHEVGTRDGLQNESTFVPTEEKIAMIDSLSECGLTKIEVTAFVSPHAIPPLRDAETVMREIRRRPGTTYSALVPNMRGAERAIESRTDELNLVMSASESHNVMNLRMTREDSFKALAAVVALSKQAATPVTVSLSCSFGCPLQGDVPLGEVMAWCERFVNEWGARGVVLCDTTGMAHPAQVARVVTAFRGRWPDTELTLHFHNTRGMGLSNVLASLQAGAHRFDASLGGIGGCPYAPGASGNICTEDVVHALSWMGYDTALDLPRLLQEARQLEALLGHPVPSQLVRAGERLKLHPFPADFEAIRERAIAKETSDAAQRSGAGGWSRRIAHGVCPDPASTELT